MLEHFDCAAILRRALSGGGEFADIYFEEGSSTAIVCEDSKIERVLAGADRGVGIRVISDLRTAYAFSNEISESSLLALAETVSRAVKGKKFDRVIDLTRKIVGTGFPILLPPEDIPLKQKIATVSAADLAARGLDGKIRQVTAMYRDGTAKAQIVNSCGEFIETARTGTVFTVQAIAAEGSLVQTGYEAIGGVRGFEIFQTMGPEELALAAARRSLMMLGARKAPAAPWQWSFPQKPGEPWSMKPLVTVWKQTWPRLECRFMRGKQEPGWHPLLSPSLTMQQ